MRSVLLAGSVLFAAATTPVAAQNAGNSQPPFGFV